MHQLAGLLAAEWPYPWDRRRQSRAAETSSKYWIEQTMCQARTLMSGIPPRIDISSSSGFRACHGNMSEAVAKSLTQSGGVHPVVCAAMELPALYALHIYATHNGVTAIPTIHIPAEIRIGLARKCTHAQGSGDHSRPLIFNGANLSEEVGPLLVCKLIPCTMRWDESTPVLGREHTSFILWCNALPVPFCIGIEPQLSQKTHA